MVVSWGRPLGVMGPSGMRGPAALGKIPVRAVSHSSKPNNQPRGAAGPINSPSSLWEVSQLGAGDLAAPRTKSLTPKQQLFAILSLLLQYMESGLGNVVRHSG